MGKKTEIKIRPARMDDMESFFTIRNDPWLIPYSSTKKGVSHKEHQKWWPRIINSPSHQMFMIEVDDKHAGFMRFEQKENDSAEVSICLLREYTGKGLGVTALIEGVKKAASKWSSLSFITAHILENNEASLRAFSKAGFAPDGNSEKPGHKKYRINTGGSPA